MTSRRLLAGIVILAASLVSSVASSAEPRYRIFQIVSNDPTFENITVSDLNDRGQLVGMAFDRFGTQSRAFVWQNGEFTDLHDIIAPGASSTSANGINNRRTIVGSIALSRGFKLRGTQVTDVTVVPDETNVTPFIINDRGQMIVESFGGSVFGHFLVEGDNAELLPALPGSSDFTIASALNERGVVAGVALFFDFTRRGVIVQNGAITDLGVPAGFDSSSALDINNRNRVVGAGLNNFGQTAATWKNGVWTLLPSIAPGTPQVSEAATINDRGEIAGGTTITEGDFASLATLWENGRALVINDLVLADDPLKPFVSLTSALIINNRGDIVSLGDDSRSPPAGSTRYFLRRVR
jgi:probable HAF family extracellular repeat protein